MAIVPAPTGYSHARNETPLDRPRPIDTYRSSSAANDGRYSIEDACRLLDLQPYVLRYWQTEFSGPLRSQRRRCSHDDKRPADARRIKELLYDQGYTIANAKTRLAAEQVTPMLSTASRRCPRRRRSTERCGSGAVVEAGCRTTPLRSTNGHVRRRERRPAGLRIGAHVVQYRGFAIGRGDACSGALRRDDVAVLMTPEAIREAHLARSDRRLQTSRTSATASRGPGPRASGAAVHRPALKAMVEGACPHPRWPLGNPRPPPIPKST